MPDMPANPSLYLSMTVQGKTMSDRIAEIRQRVEKATPGKWWASHDDDLRPQIITLGPSGEGPPDVVARLSYVRDDEFIAHAREDIPYLLEALHASEHARQQAERLAEERRKDCVYHADCRPNRQQAEAAIADAKAMNDKWADEVAARRAAEARSLALADALRTLVEEAKAHICSRGDCECATAKAVKVAESLLEQK